LTEVALISNSTLPITGNWNSKAYRSVSGMVSMKAPSAPMPVATSSHSMETTRKAPAALSGALGISENRLRGGWSYGRSFFGFTAIGRAQYLLRTNGAPSPRERTSDAL
jgi:hypothetical protein